MLDICCACVLHIAVLIVLTATFRPSYSHMPSHYRALRKRCKESSQLGRGNVNNEKVLMAVSLYDPDGILVGEDWGSAVLKLVGEHSGQ